MAGSAADVSAQADRTICMVETTAQAEDVIAGERGIMHTARPGHIVLCMSTIDPLAVRRLGEQLAARGSRCSTPRSAAAPGARSGELSIIVGGAAETVAACQDLFRGDGRARLPHGRRSGRGSR